MDFKKIEQLARNVAVRSGEPKVIENKDIVDTIKGADSDGDQYLSKDEFDVILQRYSFSYVDRTLIGTVLFAGLDGKLGFTEGCKLLTDRSGALNARFGVSVSCGVTPKR